MAGKRTDLDGADDLRDSIAHLDQVSARISRLLNELAAPRPASAPEDSDQSHNAGG